MAREVEIASVISVGTLADKLSLPVTQLITELMKNGVMATVNEQIDFDTAEIIADELGLEVKLVRQNETAEATPIRTRNTSGESRPPVVAVMGHVDHGKTSLLDAIHGTKTTASEAGGITQHISASQMEHNGRLITFLDTPGHEAFAAIRNHAAKLTDLVVLVIAADDGVKPQTLEAIRFANQAGVKILVAINKVDKEGADVNRVKQELSDHGLLAEEWGGDTIIQTVSAKTGQGVSELLDMILLLADVDELKAEANGLASGLIIESHLEKGRGPVGSVLVEAGTLKPGDFVVAGSTYAKVRNLISASGQSLTFATPSTPVVVTGFKSMPEFGEEFHVERAEKSARNAAKNVADIKIKASSRQDIASTDLMKMINRSHELTELNVLLKADVQGSLSSVTDSLKSLNNEEVAIRVVGASVGQVTANDLALAKSSEAIIYGFNVEMAANVRRLAVRDKIPVRLYKVIYELIDDAREELSNLLSPEITETELGRLNIKAIFKTTQSEIICGGEVTKGRLSVPSLATITRGKEILAEEVEVTNLKRGPENVKEVQEGELCGVSLSTNSRLNLSEGDHLNVFRRETSQRHL